MAHDITKTEFSLIYKMYVQKLERKGRTVAELKTAVYWLTGYDGTGLQAQIDSGADLKSFFANAPRLNPDAVLIKGSVCGYKVEEIADPLMQKIRYMDKLVDELANGKPMEKVLRKR